jgi:hypothetical protein
MSTWNGNVDLTQIDALLSIAVFLDDQVSFDLGIERLKKRLPAYFYLASDAASVRNYGGSTDANWGNYSPVLKWTDGLTQETCRDNGHHAQFAIAGALSALETAYLQGIDLYTPNQERMIDAMELMALQLNSKDMQGTCGGAVTADRYNTLEVGYNHYHNRKGIAMPQTQAEIAKELRNGAQQFNMFHETLTNGDIVYGLSISSSGTSSTTASSSTIVLSSSSVGGTSSAVVSSSSATVTSSSSTLTLASMIEDLEDGDSKTLWNGIWFSYTDSDVTGASTISPLTSITVPFLPVDGGPVGSTKTATFTYTLDAGALTYDPFVGFGIKLQASELAYSLSSCTEIRYAYKGPAHRFRVNQPTITDGNFYGVNVVASAAWTTKSILWTDLLQDPTWGVVKPMTKNAVEGFSWQVQTTTGATGSISIDNIQCIGATAPVVTSSSGTATSSSAVASSSSSTPTALNAMQSAWNMSIHGETLALSSVSGSQVKVTLTNLLGNQRKVLFAGVANGSLSLGWGAAMPQGRYILSVQVGHQTRQMLVSVLGH